MCNYIIGSKVNEEDKEICIVNVQTIQETCPSKAVATYEREYRNDGEAIVIGEKTNGCITIDPDVVHYAMDYIIGKYINIDDYVVVAPIVMSKENK